VATKPGRELLKIIYRIEQQQKNKKQKSGCVYLLRNDFLNFSVFVCY
jgi:hypothetical protein